MHQSDEDLIKKLTTHAIGIAAEPDDELLADIQQHLLATGRLEKVEAQAPCGPSCICIEQLGFDPSLHKTYPVLCHRAPTPIQGRHPACIKFYDRHKKFGFVILDSGGRDVFLHSRVLGQLDPAYLQPGNRVSVTIEECNQGYRVTTIVRAHNANQA